MELEWSFLFSIGRMQCFPESMRQLFWSDVAYFENCEEFDQGSFSNGLYKQWRACKWFRRYIHPWTEGLLVATAAIPTGLLDWRLRGRFSLDACAQNSSESLKQFISGRMLHVFGVENLDGQLSTDDASNGAFINGYGSFQLGNVEVAGVCARCRGVFM